MFGKMFGKLEIGSIDGDPTRVTVKLNGMDISSCTRKVALTCVAGEPCVATVDVIVGELEISADAKLILQAGIVGEPC